MTKSKVIVETDLDVAPAYGSEGWDAYVMSQFKEDELIDGAPLCHGLRRVARNLLGEVIFSSPTIIHPAVDPNGPGRATVVYQITFLWKEDGSTRVFGDVADVWHGNTEDLYAAHPAATASTMAEARTLRKALAIRKVSANELCKKDIGAIVRAATGVKVEAPTTGESKPTDLMTAPQKNFLNSLCSKLNVSVVALIATTGMTVDTVTRDATSKLITKLNEFQQKGMDTIKDSNPELIGYDENWK
jgi:hypothetical protein